MNNVSLVMAVFNDAEVLPRTLNALAESHKSLAELIIVDDGSTDESTALLNDFAGAISNCQIIRQSNQGLTAALVRGCAATSGRFIARQDAGDVSLPHRFERQIALLQDDPEIAMVSCGTRFVDPQGKTLYEVQSGQNAANQNLSGVDHEVIDGPPHHGSVMFRKDVYQQVGGYRREFYVSQDLDLWLRMSEVGGHYSLPDILYQANSSPGSISFTRPHLQQQVKQLMLQARRRRQNGEPETDILMEIEKVSRQSPRNVRAGRAAYYFFVAGCLRSRSPQRARKYYLQALRENPFYFKALIRFLQTRG